jgi:hypothetical protein
MKIISILISIVTLCITSVFAQSGMLFEFSANSNMGAVSTIQSVYSKEGTRTEMHISVPDMPGGGFARTIIIKSSKPNTKYMLDDKNKTYSVRENKEVTTAAAARAVVKVVGKEKEGKYNCMHVIITKGKMESEYWTTTEIEDYEAFTKTNAGNKYMASISDYALLKSNGAAGFVVKSITPEGKKGRVTMELIKVEKKDLPKDFFEIPEDYKMNFQSAIMPAQPAEVENKNNTATEDTKN